MHKYSVSSAAAAAASRMAVGPSPKSTSQQQQQPLDEGALFQSLEPAECKKIEEEFERLTSETDLEKILEVEMEEKRARIAAAGAASSPLHAGSPVKRKSSPETSSAASSSIPFADEDTISALLPSSGGDPAEEAVNVAVTKRPGDLAAAVPRTSPGGSPRRKASLAKQEEALSPDLGGCGGGEAPATSSSGSYNSVKIKPSLDSSSEVDEFQDEIHFDPTISSGHLGYQGHYSALS